MTMIPGTGIEFRELSENEMQIFKEWARENYKVGSEINTVWHPVVQEECRVMVDESISISTTIKVAVNRCYGGFGLSKIAEEKLAKLKGIEVSALDIYDIRRDDKNLVKVIEELDEKANGDYSELEIVEVPADVKWHIEEYDGNEWVAENHRTWR
jgi:hypothetical protein